MSSDRLPSLEQSIIRQDIVGRWRGAWELMNDSIDSGGISYRGIAQLFLKSTFAPESFPKAEIFAPKVRVLVQKLAGMSPYSSLNPSESVLAEGEKRLIQRLLDVTPATVPRAMETIDELAKMSQLTLWTVGDYVEATHSLPKGLLSHESAIAGTGHQLWKLWKLGLTNRKDIAIAVSDNKTDTLMQRITHQEKNRTGRFVFFDDRVENLERVKNLIDQGNDSRELTGDRHIECDLVLVNQGSRRKVPPPEIETRGSVVKYSVIDRFAEAPGHVRGLQKSPDERIGVYCDVDGVITDNTQVRKEWDDIAYQIVREVVERARLVNPQKRKRGGEQLTTADLRLPAVKEFIEAARVKGLRIGVKNGAYDIIQPGHIGGLDDAKDACDVLIVLLNSDESIRRYKGVKEHVPRPLVPEIQRADVLLGLDPVDVVVLFDEQDPSEIIRVLRPDVYVSSVEYEGKGLPEFRAAEEVGADVVYTNMREGYSTSSVVKRLLAGFLTVMEGKGVFSGLAAKVLRKKAGYAREVLSGMANSGDHPSYIPVAEKDAYKRMVEKEAKFDNGDMGSKIIGNCTLEEEINIVDALMWLPLDLKKDVRTIRIVESDEHILRASYGIALALGQAEMVLPKDLYNMGREAGQFAAIHELGGHGLLGMIYKLHPEKFFEIRTMWMEAIKGNPGLLEKDNYVRQQGRILNRLKALQTQIHLGTLKQKGRFIVADYEEFIANRMAEFFIDMIHNKRNMLVRDPVRYFTSQEQQDMTQCSMRTYQIWKELTEKQ